jgi:hypothetical protein
MGAIKDITDLVTQLANSVEDRRFAGELRQIQGMIGNLQSEQAILSEKNIELMTKNQQLKEAIAHLKKQPTMQNSSEDSIGEGGEKVLEFLSLRDSGIFLEDLAIGVGMSNQIAKYLIDKLMAPKYYIVPDANMNRPTKYSLGSAGRDYLFEKGLLK